MKKLILLSLVGIGIYLILSRREAKAEEISEIPAKIPATPQAPDNPAINMIDPRLEEMSKRLIVEGPGFVYKEKGEICKQVKFITIPPFLPMIATMIMVRPIAIKTEIEIICGPNLKTIQEKAELRAQAIFSPFKAAFQILD